MDLLEAKLHGLAPLGLGLELVAQMLGCGKEPVVSGCHRVFQMLCF